MKKIILTTLATGTLLLNGNGLTEHEKAINYDPTIKQEFKTLDRNTIQNVNDSSDVLITDLDLKENKKYIVSFKNDDIIKIEEK